MTPLLIHGLLFAIIFISVFKVLSSWKEKKARSSHYPPGPLGSFFGGNIKDIPIKNPWLAYADLGKRYGDVIHLQLSGDHIVVLNSVKVANDLLDKRSNVYSGRGNKNIIEMTGWDINMAFQDYGDAWRKSRRVYQQLFRPDAVANRLRLPIENCVALFLKNLVNGPERFLNHIDVLSSGLALTIMYGVEVTDGSHPLLVLARKAIHTVDDIVDPRFVFIATRFPFVKFVPKWVPFFGSARRTIDNTQKNLHDLREIPLQTMQRNVDLNLEGGGLVGDVMRRKLINEESTKELEMIKDVAATVFAASADTTLSSTVTFFLAMVQNPEVQRKAQDEIDAVIGRDRLPTLEDRQSLPYLEAIYREVMRIHPPIPLGLAHQTTEDDFYNGYYIPKGTTVFANIWAMTHDERIYTQPDDFYPERFFNDSGGLNDDDRVLAFGFGRRVCVGRHMAEATLWLAFASVLASFTINKKKDVEGRYIDVPESYSDGPFFSYPLPFTRSITPRHPGVASIIAEL